MRGLLLAFAVLFAQDPGEAIELFRMGKYEEAYPLFKKLFERQQDYLWGTYAVECLLQAGREGDYQRWLQSERTRNRLSPWGMAWELRRRFLRGDSTATREWETFLKRGNLSLAQIEALAEAAFRVWGQTEWQRIALQIARQHHPNPAAYAELLILSYERDNQLGPAWQEWLRLWQAQRISRDTLITVLGRYLQAGFPSDSAELTLLLFWQDHPHPDIARVLSRLYQQTGDYVEALRYARLLQRHEGDCQPFYEIGWNAQEKGLLSVAQEAYRFILQQGEACPYYASVLPRYLQIEALVRHPRRAAQVVDSLWRYNPTQPALLIEKAHWLLKLGEADSTLALLHPFEPSSASFLAQKYLLLSQAALQKGDFAQARLYLLEIESRLPQSSWISEVYFQLARLAYFQGEFELAKTRLRLLKNNTQDDLSNDAIQLFWMIEDNLKPDTLPEPLQLFARAELYRLQNQPEKAFQLLDTIEKRYRGHPITDDVLWQKAQHYFERGDTLSAKKYIELLADYPDSESLYRDDALYILAQLARTPAEAARYYERIIRETPESLYARIAQAKLRELAR